jgi:hypothetical protein
MNCGCGMTCLNYLKAWQHAGVWEKVEHVLRTALDEAERIDWSRVRRDTARIRPPEGKTQTEVAPAAQEGLQTGQQISTKAQDVSPLKSSSDSRVAEGM